MIIESLKQAASMLISKGVFLPLDTSMSPATSHSACGSNMVMSATDFSRRFASPLYLVPSTAAGPEVSLDASEKARNAFRRIFTWIREGLTTYGQGSAVVLPAQSGR